MPAEKQESEILEYKKSFAEKEVAGRDICAFANKKGGLLFFGIKLENLRDEGKVYFEGPQRSQKAYWRLNDRA